MRSSRFECAAAVIGTLVLACVVPASGCGSKKRSGPTIEKLRALALAEKVPERQARKLVMVARLQAQSSDSGGACQTLSKARSLVAPRSAAGTGTSVDPAAAGPCLVDIAEVYARVGERTTAKDTLAQARRLAPEVADPVSRARMLAKAGGIYGAKAAGLADASNARAVLAEAAALAAGVDDRFRPEALAAVATGYLTAGLAAEASATADALETLARAAADRPKAEALAVAATVRSQAGAADAARALLDEAAAAAAAIGGAENRTYALVSVARATGAAGDRAGALGLLAEAEKAAGKVGDADAQRTATERVRAAQDELQKRK